MTREDQVIITVPPTRSNLDLREAIIEAIRAALPPGRRVKSITLTPREGGGYEGSLTRTTET